MSAFKVGDLVYSESGQAFQYVAPAPDGHVVREVWEHDEYPNETLGEPVVLARVYAKPGKPKYDQEIAEARAQSEKVRTELAELRREAKDAKSERDALLKEFAKHPQLRPVLEWMKGEITHLVTIEYYGSGITIKPIAEAVMPASADDRRNGEIRLLALYGGYSGPEARKTSWPCDDLRWQLNTYRDGSGNNVVCLLGTSEENAKERLQEYLDRGFTKRDQHSRHVAWARSAMKLGLSVPEELSAKVVAEDATLRAHRLKQLRDEAASLEVRRAEHLQQIAELESA